jgi:integrase
MAVPAALMALLADHLAGRGLTGADSEAWVFTAPSGGHLDYAHFRRRVWGPATASAGLDGLGFHDLRRANATGMVLDGIDLKTAQTRLGHSDPRLTLSVYAQATNAADAAAAEQLGTRFMKLSSPGTRTTLWLRWS